MGVSLRANVLAGGAGYAPGMDIESATPPRTGLRARLLTWGGGVLYLVTLLLLLGGAPRASGALHAVGSLLALSLLVGLLRRRPLSALALTLFGSVAVVVFRNDGGQAKLLSFLAMDVALGFIVATRARRVAIAAVSVSLILQVVTVAAFSRGPDKLTVAEVIGLLAMATSWMFGLLIRERREHTVALRSQEVAEAVTAERLRIARELHDMVAHSIGIIAIQAGVGSRVIDTQPAEAREALRAIEATSRETLSGLRRTLVALRQADPDDGSGQAPLGQALGPAPGLADIERLVAATLDAGVRVEVRWVGERRQLPPDIDLSAYRIVQEAVTNVVRHAGIGHCRVTVDHGVEELAVEVVDDGRGMPGGAAGAGFGIVGMRERVGLLHGRFSAGPLPEGGFRVAARLPVPVGSPVVAR